ncbi:MAG: YfcE family phosphodiesterase [Candidatus Hydrogenedentota bacterium]
MRIALIGDIHANLPALESVLEHATKNHCEAIWNIGDFVGYGPFPDEVVRRIIKEKALSIIGNYDLKVLELGSHTKPSGKTTTSVKKNSEKLLAFKWTYNNLTKSSKEYLASLPREIRLVIEGKKILLVHGTPYSIEEHLYPHTKEKRLKEIAASANADIIICGHSHNHFIRPVNNVLFINTGSVGRPDDGDPRACYAILDISKDSVSANHFRIDYDIDKTVNEIRKQALPENFAQMIIKGRSLEYVVKKTEDRRQNKKKQKIRESVYKFAESYEYAKEHSEQVRFISFLLFDELKTLHKLNEAERFYLECACILHDIGLMYGLSGHHKTSLQLILQSSLFNKRERLIIGSIARYHRKALPSKKHKHFAQLDKKDQKIVCILSGILRLADALDTSHQSIIQNITCKISNKKIKITCYTKSQYEEPLERIIRKAELFKQIFNREPDVRWVHQVA